MMRYLTAILVGCILATAAAAMPIFGGARVGGSVPNLHGGNNEISSGYTSRFAPYFGLFAEFQLEPTFSIQPELNFSPQGGERQGMQPIITDLPGMTLPPGTTLYADFENVAKINYLEIPVLAKFSFGHGRFFVDAGPHIAFRLSSENVTSGSSQIYWDAAGTMPVSTDPDGTVLPPGVPGYPLPAQDFGATTSNEESVRLFNWGFQGGLGIVQRFGPGNVFFDARVGYGLRPVQVNPSVDGSSNTGSLVMAIGYAYRLGGS